MTKTELRKQIRSLEAPSAEIAAEKSRRICDRLLEMPAWQNARTVALYAANAHEPDPAHLWGARGERVFAFPRVEGQGIEQERLAFYRIDAVDELELSRWGLHEPRPDVAREVDPAVIDLIIIPALAFTANGERLGRGRGHYDRFLPRLRPDAVKIGICFAPHRIPQIPVEPHDIRMDHVIFE